MVIGTFEQSTYVKPTAFPALMCLDEDQKIATIQPKA